MNLPIFFTAFLMVGLFWVSYLLSWRVAAYLKRLILLPLIWLMASGSLVVLMTEGLSLGRHLDWGHLFSGWSLVFIAALIFEKFLARRQKVPRFKALSDLALFLPQDWLEWFMAGVIVALGLATAFICLRAAPNNADSLGYHNARVMHWWENRSVAHYFTLDLRQIRNPPLASYFRLQSFALLECDWFFNFTQWIAYFFSVLLGGLISWELVPDRRAAFFSAVLVATIPMAVLQATSSQNDLTTGCYALAATFALLLIKKNEPNRSSWLWMVFWILIGLGALTKGTFYIFGGVIALFSLPDHLRLVRKGDFKSLALVLLGLSAALAFNLPHFFRNLNYFHGQPVPNTEAVALKTWVKGAPILPLKRVTNQIVHTAVLQLDFLKKTPGALEKVELEVSRLEAALGLPSFDPSTQLSSEAGIQYFWAAPIPDEDYAGCALHWALGIFALGILGVLSIQGIKQRPHLRTMLLLGFVSALCLAIEVKWMPWNNRLLLPAIMMVCASISCVFAQIRRKTLIYFGLTVSLALWSAPYLLINYSHPLLPRTKPPVAGFLQQTRWQNYFRGNDPERLAYEKVIAQLPISCNEQTPVGLNIVMAPEYLFWATARHLNRKVFFESVSNTARPVAGLLRPLVGQTYCAIISYCKSAEPGLGQLPCLNAY